MFDQKETRRDSHREPVDSHREPVAVVDVKLAKDPKLAARVREEVRRAVKLKSKQRTQ